MSFAFHLLILLLPACALLPAHDLTEVRLQHDGQERAYYVHRPSRPEQWAGLRPLVMVLHGGGATGRKMVRLTYGRFNDLADRDDVVVVYPEGIDHAWNDGRDPSVSKAHREQVDDVGFLRAVIRDVSAREQVDRVRVFVTAMSNGGLLAFRLACELPGEIRAIAALTASIPARIKPVCQHATTVSLLALIRK